METFTPIEVKIKGIDESMTLPIQGKSLFKIYIELDQDPPYEWDDIFIQSWNHPPQFTSMHRPSIATVQGKYICLNGTTADEIEKYHKTTLKLALVEANRNYNEWKQRKIEQKNREAEELSNKVNAEKEKQKNIKFE